VSDRIKKLKNVATVKKSEKKKSKKTRRPEERPRLNVFLATSRRYDFALTSSSFSVTKTTQKKPDTFTPFLVLQSQTKMLMTFCHFRF
jgi:hypothetical protein